MAHIPDNGQVSSGRQDTEDYSEVLAAATAPWAFTQEYPLRTGEFCKEAEKRRIPLREEQLPELWHIGALAPFVEVRNTPPHRPRVPDVPEPINISTNLVDLRTARDAGRLIDAEEMGFRPQLRFRRSFAPRSWWNGLLYARWQLLGLERFRLVLEGGTWHSKRDEHGDTISRHWRTVALAPQEMQYCYQRRKLAALLVTLEPRYLPVIDPRWVEVHNAAVGEWEVYAQGFDPVAVLSRLGRNADDLLVEADQLLRGAGRIEVLGYRWSQLLRRAPRRSWEEVAGDELIALDRRIAAEILLRCYEDLAAKGCAAPLVERRDTFHCQHERLSDRPESLDGRLSGLGLSPHPGVVLVIEGETEEVLFPLVRDHLQMPRQAEVVQSLVLRGVGKDLTKLAAFASAPLIERKERDGWLLVKPPVVLMIAIDPDAPYDTPPGIEYERKKIIDEIVAVVRAQGVDPDRNALETLVRVTTWTDGCFEFQQFSNEELADALIAVHPRHGGLTRERLAEALSHHRAAHHDIKHVWANWRPEPSKRDLARALWPVLRKKLDAAAGKPTEEWPAIARLWSMP